MFVKINTEAHMFLNWASVSLILRHLWTRGNACASSPHVFSSFQLKSVSKSSLEPSKPHLHKILGLDHVKIQNSTNRDFWPKNTWALLHAGL